MPRIFFNSALFAGPAKQRERASETSKRYLNIEEHILGDKEGLIAECRGIMGVIRGYNTNFVITIANGR